MNKFYYSLIALAAFFIILGVTIFTVRLLKRRKQPKRFKESWLEIQRLCASKQTWGLAVINADKLLEKALKLKHYKGKTMGERMVAAQREISDNDSLWYAHNLAKKILDDKSAALRESQAKKALVGVGKGLRDLGLLDGK